jgi:hypothetical protein
MCVFSSRDIATNSYVAFLGFFLLCINLHLDVIARGFDPAVDENPTLKYDKDVRCGYHAIRMVARLLKCDQAIHDKIPLDAPALSVAECIEQLEAIELSVEPAKLIGNIFAAVDSGVSERDDGCVAILLLFGTEQTELDIGHFFVCFRF